MEDKLQQIFKIRPLQSNCIAYRNCTNEYRKMIKQTCVAELKNLLQVEMKLEQVQLKMPKEEQFPNINEELKKSKADVLLKEYIRVEEGLNYL